MVPASLDSPNWTFGLNPKHSGPRVPGPGTYDVAGRLDGKSVGTHFSRIGAKPKCPRADVKRLVFGTEVEDEQKPGPGAYDVAEKRLLRWNVRPGGAKHQAPRFPESSPATDAGPGAYIPSDFVSKGPTYSMTGRPSKTLDMPNSPGPGEYVEVKHYVRQTETYSVEGFGKRDSPRFATEAAHSSPGPGAFQSSEFRPQIGKNITFGRQFRPPGWSDKIKEITRFACELDDGEDRESSRKRVGRFRAPLQKYATSRHNGTITRRYGRPSSAPPSSRFRRACARGRRLEINTTGGGQQKHSDKTAGSGGSTACHRPRSIADVVKEAGRKRRAKAAAAAATVAGAVESKGATRQNTDGRGAVFGSSPQRPPDDKRTPGPTSYRPVTLDEASRSSKVVSIGGKSRRELPGVGEYDLRAAERAAREGSTAATLTFGRKPSGAPYDPALNRYVRADDLTTPSVHAYFPESAKGGGGDGGLGGNSPTPPAWSFGGKRSTTRPPDGPGPGNFRPPYDNSADPCCSSSSATGIRFAAGREVMSGCVSGVPWVEVEERAARGDGGGGDAKLYLPERNRVGARAFMRSRPLPRPRRVEFSSCRVDSTRGR
ncbi:unnamed protein product [Pylaiella littoralis]